MYTCIYITISSLILWEFHIMQSSSIHFPVPSIPDFTITSSTPSPQKIKLKPNQANNGKKTFLTRLSRLPFQYLFFCLSAAGSHGVSSNKPFVQSASLAIVHCNESLVWLKVSGFWYTVITEPSSKSCGIILLYKIKICHPN